MLATLFVQLDSKEDNRNRPCSCSSQVHWRAAKSAQAELLSQADLLWNWPVVMG
jgi:hypothetical protein